LTTGGHVRLADRETIVTVGARLVDPRDHPEGSNPLSVVLRLVGQASKRGLVPRLPTTEALLTDIEAWLAAEAADTAGPSRRTGDGTEEPGLVVLLHPAASDVEFAVAEGGRVTFGATTAEVGPGYHTYVCELVRRLGTDLSIAWEPTDPAAGTGDQTGYFDSGKRADAESVLLGWLHDALQAASAARARGGNGLHLVPFGDHRFVFEGAIATALGPRDDPWLKAAIDDPRVAIDVWPWTSDARDARYLLNRALVQMWSEVRWRAPATQSERTTIDEVLRLLRKAFPLDPELPYPWREWKELLDFGGTSDPMYDRIAKEAERAGEGLLIGYRRDPVVAVHGGWALEIPGSFAERRSPEEWWAGEGGRSITLAAVSTGTDTGPMTAEAFLDQVSGNLGGGALTHRDGQVVGKARLAVDDGSEVGLAILDAYSAVRGSGAAIRIEIHDPADWEWALGMWRSLRPA
jgi:hypothetical protein